MRYLLDTNIISELFRKIPNSNVIVWMKTFIPQNLYISCITIGEIEKGINQKRKTDKVAALSLANWQQRLIEEYSSRTIDINTEICKYWGKLLVIDSTNPIDTLMAAQAIINDMVVVTRNIKHFEKFGVQLINPFEVKK